ncbi:polysaccharide pyruvyl transferase family protein [Oculatella sp. LEGE 06141]|uniref:polysaccharide pyruvyl transferase family protein n=1 Tax=Oculatella sp. LEGE 06141 TaxID=1828648 RepID=UPI0018828619|nr:polysaccharide pyruvyl transferase family protein [Oculatella sp. LEGE 06141]MBE9179720.1 polysaccharide pyruvyl transferase family protein [Oculatella sp. LEGE 06141]
MKAVITGITGLRNRGVEAMVDVTVEQLTRHQPTLTVDVLSETPDYDQVQLHHDNVSVIGRKNSLDWKRLLYAKASKFYTPLAPDYGLVKDASVVIASGGDVFSSDYGLAFLEQELKPLKFALNAKIPVVFLAHSIGPFKTEAEASAWLEVARQSALVTVREALSYRYVTKELGLSETIVEHTADPAFLLTPPPAELSKAMLRFYGITDDRPVVAVAPSQGITKYTGANQDQHLNTWCQIIQTILETLDAQVLLVPHVQEIKYRNDDRILATNLLRTLGFDSRVCLAGGNHSASEFKGLIGACDMVIAERMHACIAGLSSCVCTVPIGYSVKAEGIMADLLGDNHKGLVISFQEFLDADQTCAMIQSAWKRRHEVVEQLTQTMPQIKEKAEKNFGLISRILD